MDVLKHPPDAVRMHVCPRHGVPLHGLQRVPGSRHDGRRQILVCPLCLQQRIDQSDVRSSDEVA